MGRLVLFIVRIGWGLAVENFGEIRRLSRNENRDLKSWVKMLKTGPLFHISRTGSPQVFHKA